MIYQHEFRGKGYLSSVIGCSNPEWAAESFRLEADLRHRWWQIKEGDVVIDAGAGYGSYTLTALASGASLVVAVEPNKEAFFTLCGNLAINRYQPSRFAPINCVLGDRSGLVCGYDPLSHSAVAGPGMVMDHRMSDTVDAVCLGYGLGRLDWLKIDVEGMEHAVIVGGMGAIDNFLPRILIENHTQLAPSARDRIASILSPMGYQERRETGDGANEDWSLWCVKGKHEEFPT